MKRFFKLVKKLYENFWVQLIFFVCLSVIIFAIAGAFTSGENWFSYIIDILTSLDVLSVLLAAIASIILAKLAFRAKGALEESLKLEDDHHKIISKYSSHPKIQPERDRSFYCKEGAFMYLNCTPAVRHRPKNRVADNYSREYAQRRQEIEQYVNDGRLCLSSVCVYANVAGDARLDFDDCATMHDMPAFLRENAAKLIEAHGTSTVRNNITVRLKDETFEDGKLTLKTQRSQYFYMLITNRCMDYKIGDGLTVRGIYEYNSKVTPLAQSVLGNQIGINGLIITTDGYILLERRGKQKATWKGKFAQPISLAMKENDIKLKDGAIADGEESAELILKNIIYKTILTNYGLTEKDLLPFSIRENFFGLARDLLEGGKPNLYFYVVANKTAAELKALLEERAAAAAKLGALTKEEYAARTKNGEGLPVLSRDKLESEYYLVKHDDVNIDFGYRLTLDPRAILRIRRRFRPCTGAVRTAFDGFGYRMRRATRTKIKRECGEALLACLYFADVCIDRMKSAAAALEKDREQTNGEKAI